MCACGECPSCLRLGVTGRNPVVEPARKYNPDDWKPGDIAIVECGNGDACGPHKAIRSTSDHEWFLLEEHGEYTRRATPLRRLLVIDPTRLTWDGRTPTAAEWTAWAESLPAGEFATGVLRIADALRAVESRKPPKLDEPLGLGAVVRDTKGDHWVRTDHGRLVWSNGRFGAMNADGDEKVTLCAWADIDAVEVLSEGVR